MPGVQTSFPPPHEPFRRPTSHFSVWRVIFTADELFRLQTRRICTRSVYHSSRKYPLASKRSLSDDISFVFGAHVVFQRQTIHSAGRRHALHEILFTSAPESFCWHANAARRTTLRLFLALTAYSSVTRFIPASDDEECARLLCKRSRRIHRHTAKPARGRAIIRRSFHGNREPRRTRLPRRSNSDELGPLDSPTAAT